MAPTQQPAFQMLRSILFLGLAFIVVYFLKLIWRLVTVRFVLRHIPGPKASSLLWGEEWCLYHNTPGSQYAAWHNEYGKVVKFTGAFGVSGFDLKHSTSITYLSIKSFPLPILVQSRTF